MTTVTDQCPVGLTRDTSMLVRHRRLDYYTQFIDCTAGSVVGDSIYVAFGRLVDGRHFEHVSNTEQQLLRVVVAYSLRIKQPIYNITLHYIKY